MVVDTISVRQFAASDSLTTAMGKVGKDVTNFEPGEIACGKRINPFLYALDMAIPALELHQQDQCSFASNAIWWLLFKVTYVILGWIITAMTILTCSGILRRQRES
jgi:hypothetical protein